MVRIPYLTPENAVGDSAELLNKLAAAGIEMPLLAAVANSVGAVRNFARLGSALIRHTKLDSRLRELAVLHLAVHLGCRYEWYEHERIALESGVTEQELNALQIEGPSSTLFDARERAVFEFVENVVSRSVDDAIWSRVSGYFDDEEMADLVLSASWWGGMVPRVIDAFGVVSPRSER